MNEFRKKLLLHTAINVIRQELEPLFAPGTKLSLIARTPGNDEADVLVSSDTLDDLAAVIERSRSRPELG